MKVLLLMIFLALVPAEASFKTYCLFEDKTCDEFWQPFDNMIAALVGYDLPKGNPWATDSIEDPGLRKQIFNATWEDPANGDYVMETGITAKEYHMCSDFISRAATNMKGYEMASSASSLTGSGIDVGLEAEEDGGKFEGLLPSMVKVAWQKTKEYEKVRQFMFRSRGAVVVSEAHCITHKVDISHFLTPGFHPAFIEVLKYLEKQDSSVRQTRAFKRFVRDYGTHYVSSSLLGAKISATVFYSNYERLKYGKQRLFNCTREATMRAFDIPVDDDDDIVDPDDDENDVDATAKMKTCPEIDLMDEERILKSTYGTAPKDGDLDKWTDKDDFLPMPVKFELTPIVNLFTVENLDDRLNISSKKILKWFLPLYLKYCTVFDLECGVETGCGFDDNCAFDENCVSDRLAKGGHRCNSPSWAAVPNWPQMPQKGINKKGTEPESPNISWFFEKDADQSGTLTLNELWVKYTENNWYNHRYQTAIESLIQEADVNIDRGIDMAEYIKLHERHPWYSEQISFMLMNTDSNDHLSKQELLEASRISPDMHQLNFGEKQLENLVNGLFSIGDKDNDGKIKFSEYVEMTRDVFVDNFAPNVFKKIMK